MKPKLYLISGNDDFAIKAGSREIITSLCGNIPEDHPALEVISGDRDDIKPEEILAQLLDTLYTPPFLSESKIVWLRHFAYFDKVLTNDAKAAIVSRVNALIEFIKQGIPNDLTLIIDGPDIDQRKAFFKTCKAAGALINFFRKADASSRDFAQNQRERIVEFSRKNKKTIDPPALQYLSETIGSDTGRLQNELEKLFCYVDNREKITLTDCKSVCSKTPEALSWDFANALYDGKTTAALEVVSTLIEQMKSQRGGNAELSILHHAIRGFQELVQVKVAALELSLPQQVGKSYFYSIPTPTKERYPDNILLKVHPFRAYKMCESAQRFNDRDLAQALGDLLETNRKLVSGVGDSRMVLEQLVVSITGCVKKMAGRRMQRRSSGS